MGEDVCVCMCVGVCECGESVRVTVRVYEHNSWNFVGEHSGSHVPARGAGSLLLLTPVLPRSRENRR